MYSKFNYTYPHFENKYLYLIPLQKRLNINAKNIFYIQKIIRKKKKLKTKSDKNCGISRDINDSMREVSVLDPSTTNIRNTCKRSSSKEIERAGKIASSAKLANVDLKSYFVNSGSRASVVFER